ncbi:MAG: hypothetical protein ACM3X8_00075, partial [Methanomicrobiales archaeon]
NVELFGAERYTISLRALRSVLSGGSRFAMVAAVPGEKHQETSRRSPATYQQRIPVTVAS